MTRVLSYNMLAGGYNVRNNTRRTEQLVKMIRSVQPDIVGLPEGIHQQMKQRPLVVEEMAEALGMQLIVGGSPDSLRDYQTALLTRLPVVYIKSHARPGVLARPVLEVCLEESDGRHLTVFLIHLSAAFNKGWAGSHIRIREVRAILEITASLRAEQRPHLLMGDFNSLAPKESFKASHLLKYVVRMDARIPVKTLNDGHPHINSIVPPKLRWLVPFLRFIAHNDVLCALFDLAAYFYAPRSCIHLLQSQYNDCFRKLYPHDPGFTCPAAAPAGRIDYIFANDVLAACLLDCSVVAHGEDNLAGSAASDHLGVCAEFGAGVPERWSAIAPQDDVVAQQSQPTQS
jgi:Metal-dependent hydrolase